jgi:hypothetical protein
VGHRAIVVSVVISLTFMVVSPWDREPRMGCDCDAWLLQRILFAQPVQRQPPKG